MLKKKYTKYNKKIKSQRISNSYLLNNSVNRNKKHRIKEKRYNSMLKI